MAAVWRSRDGIGCINEVTLLVAQLVLGWVNNLDRRSTSVYNQSPGSTQPPRQRGNVDLEPHGPGASQTWDLVDPGSRGHEPQNEDDGVISL